MKTVLVLACTGVLCIILTLGLWPFHAPNNDVTWLRDQNGLHFGSFGSVMSSATFNADADGNSDMSLEIWFRPRRIWDSGTLVSLCKFRALSPLSLCQLQTTLLLRTNSPNTQFQTRTALLSIEGALTYPNRPVFLSITAAGQECKVYVNGVLSRTARPFPLSAKNLTGRLILGDSPGQNDNWAGEIRGLAFYRRRLTAFEIFDHYATWVKTGRPAISADQNNMALFLFRERQGNVVRDEGTSGLDLYIPKTYRVMEKIALEPFWNEFQMTRNYWGAVFKNIIGFIPLGFCFYACLQTALPRKRAALLTIAIGTTVSLIIETLQAFLPTRDSGTTDIITNTIGTWVGVASYNIFAPILCRFFRWWPFPAPLAKRPNAA